MKLAWKSRSQYVFEKKLFGPLYPTWTNFSEKIFLNDFLSCFELKYCTVSQNIIFMSLIYLHFSNCKFLTFWSIDWFRFQKPLAIGPFWIPRCQDFWDKSLGWFLGFQFIYLWLNGTLCAGITRPECRRFKNMELTHLSLKIKKTVITPKLVLVLNWKSQT